MRGFVLSRTLPVLVLLFAPFAAPPGAAEVTVAYDQEDTLTMGAGDSIRLATEGTGWGRLEVTAAEDLSLRFVVTHPTIADLCIFSRSGDGVYDQGHVTGLLMGRPTGSVWQHHWTWTGTGVRSFWPSQDGACGESRVLSLAAGEVAVVAFGDTVGGYAITLDASEGTTEPVDAAWRLGPNPAFITSFGASVSEAGFRTDNAAVAHETYWAKGFHATRAAVSIYHWEAVRTFGVDESHTRPQLEPHPYSLSWTSRSVATGNLYSKTTASFSTDATHDYTASLHFQQTGAWGEHGMGAGLMVLPTDPLS